MVLGGLQGKKLWFLFFIPLLWSVVALAPCSSSGISPKVTRSPPAQGVSTLPISVPREDFMGEKEQGGGGGGGKNIHLTSHFTRVCCQNAVSFQRGLQGHQAVPGVFRGCSAPSVSVVRSKTWLCSSPARRDSLPCLHAQGICLPLLPSLLPISSIILARAGQPTPHCTSALHSWQGTSGRDIPLKPWLSLLPAVSDPAGWRCSSNGMFWSFPSHGISSAAASSAPSAPS